MSDVELPKPVDVLGIRVHPVTRTQLLDAMLRWGHEDRGRLVFNVNVHAMNIAARDTDFANALARADIVFCDGFGVKWGARLLDAVLPERMTPPDWIPEFLEQMGRAGQSVFFLGDRPGVASLAQRVLLEHSPGRWAAGSHQGFFEKNGQENDAVINEINASGATHLWVGLGMPLQEKWISENAHRLKPRVLLSVGAAFHWIAGVERRPPEWVTANGLEWAVRLARHPRRHFRRYVVGNAMFGLRIVRAVVRKKLRADR